MGTRIKDIYTLQNCITQVKGECRDIENQLDRRLDYLQDNYMGMAANSIIYSFIKSPKSLGIAKDIFAGIWKSENIKGFLKKNALRLLQAIAIRLGYKMARNYAEKNSGDFETGETENNEE